MPRLVVMVMMIMVTRLASWLQIQSWSTWKQEQSCPSSLWPSVHYKHHIRQISSFYYDHDHDHKSTHLDHPDHNDYHALNHSDLNAAGLGGLLCWTLVRAHDHRSWPTSIRWISLSSSWLSLTSRWHNHDYRSWPTLIKRCWWNNGKHFPSSANCARTFQRWPTLSPFILQRWVIQIAGSDPLGH